MTKNFTIAFVCLVAQMSTAQLTVNGSIAIKTNKILYDKVSDKMFATVPSTNGSNGNSLAVISPKTISVDKTVFAGSEPTVMAISDNSAFIYVGFRGTNSVRKYDVASQTFAAPFSMGTSVSYGPLYAGDIKVMPGSPNTIAVSKKQFNTSASFKGVAIYDEGVMRPTTSFNPENFTYDSADIIAFESPEYILGISTGTSDSKLRRIKVTANGATDINQNVTLTSYPGDFVIFEGKVIFDNGQVFDYKNSTLLGTFSNVKGSFTIDYTNRIITYANNYYSYNAGIKRFNIDTFLPIDDFPISQSEQILSVANCGQGCIAYNTESKIYFLKDNALATSNINLQKTFVITPNPVKDVLSFVTDQNIKIKSAKVFEASGRVVIEKEVLDNKIDVRNLKAGTYFVSAVDNYGRINQAKIIKN
ncbi:Por secretion system C-terminal sorting domain-containing protein [Soonwooa buanensis]|uniref:Por secretion system C-terminal sorting domain-containing protein n=1 Tax=Soonwooa buanensis TaxID=619805 RepID=A0A1T5G675_9FLAO|nr:T9SS type A sorting domain-containing protein [Soonwooa buanensis]SKC03950.1 Por secretion system C-terminal sorting domain-containing protein [Soonwooa buanensis]